MMSEKFHHSRPLLPWQQNLAQNRLYLSLCKRYRRDSRAYQGVFGDGLVNDVGQILPRPTPVAMATKLETK